MVPSLLCVLFILALFLPLVSSNAGRLSALSPYWTTLCLWVTVMVVIGRWVCIPFISSPQSYEQNFGVLINNLARSVGSRFGLWLPWPFLGHKTLSVPISVSSEGHRFISYLSTITATWPKLSLSSAIRLREIDGFICKCSHCSTHADINSKLISGALYRPVVRSELLLNFPVQHRKKQKWDCQVAQF